jgi:hypothetical protein
MKNPLAADMGIRGQLYHIRVRTPLDYILPDRMMERINQKPRTVARE